MQILWALVTPFLRKGRERWGTTSAERAGAWPGDELVAPPRWQYLNGITVAAPPEAAWPWVAQIGQGRAGFYSFERLENLVGCRITNADRVLEEHQRPSPGDEIRLHHGAPPMAVALVQPGSALVLLGGDPRGAPHPDEGEVRVSWGFFVVPAGEGQCRVLSRYRAAYGRGFATRLLYGPWLVGPIACVMQRKMLRGIKQRVEQRD